MQEKNRERVRTPLPMLWSIPLPVEKGNQTKKVLCSKLNMPSLKTAQNSNNM
uniref:Uncharacterized protein n=1 Tax=Anguilla anguilla TaxID=7936 RepID=A0A0E9SAH0_ANGAN